MELLTQIAAICGSITTIAAAAALLIKPIRVRVLGIKKLQDEQDKKMDAITDGVKCLLRSDMLNIYYTHSESDTMRQYEFENFMFLYQAYKTLGGNSFIDRIQDEVKTWEVTR